MVLVLFLQILQQTSKLGNSFPYVHSKFSIGAKHTKIYNKGTPSLVCILNFHLVPNAPKFFNISCLFSTNYSYLAFSNVTLFYVTVNFFPIYCYFISTTPTTNSAVKTLPLHTPIGLVLSFFFLFPMNSQFDFFVLTKFLFSFNIQN